MALARYRDTFILLCFNLSFTPANFTFSPLFALGSFFSVFYPVYGQFLSFHAPAFGFSSCITVHFVLCVSQYRWLFLYLCFCAVLL